MPRVAQVNRPVPFEPVNRQ